MGAALSDEVVMGLPPRFEAVGEALMSGPDAAGPARTGASRPGPAGRGGGIATDPDLIAACAVTGRELARDGISLAEALDSLRSTWGIAAQGEPAYDAVEALATAWGETTLSYVHQLSCEDPMTGLASLAHVRSRLSEVYRADAGRRCARDSRALVVVDERALPEDPVSAALHMARLGEAARTVFMGGEVIGRIGTHRLVVVAARDERLGQRVALLRRMVHSRPSGDRSTRVWIEGLPATEPAAAALLDELSR